MGFEFIRTMRHFEFVCTAIPLKWDVAWAYAFTLILGKAI